MSTINNRKTPRKSVEKLATEYAEGCCVSGTWQYADTKMAYLVGYRCALRKTRRATGGK